MIIKSRLIPDGICLNLFGTYWTRDKSWITDKVINHEKIHTAQQRELLFLPFYLLYLVEWCVKRCFYPSWTEAYYNISFEREAYRYGHDFQYLKRRKHYAWLRYLSDNKA
ncbi:MAG: hypothetical protein HDS81_07310 [Bacteroidales bacterium]|nr:hypothetical protein [Bacteroidales bacterium]MDE5828676.1 hypothetical protein [Duncaniella sp.]